VDRGQHRLHLESFIDTSPVVVVLGQRIARCRRKQEGNGSEHGRLSRVRRADEAVNPRFGETFEIIDPAETPNSKSSYEHTTMLGRLTLRGIPPDKSAPASHKPRTRVEKIRRSCRLSLVPSVVMLTHPNFKGLVGSSTRSKKGAWSAFLHEGARFDDEVAGLRTRGHGHYLLATPESQVLEAGQDGCDQEMADNARTSDGARGSLGIRRHV
jgi:hypothetical protein